jgi:hypothetical protein
MYRTTRWWIENNIEKGFDVVQKNKNFCGETEQHKFKLHLADITLYIFVAVTLVLLMLLL